MTTDADLPAVDTGPAVDAIEYTSFGSPIDLYAVKKRDIQCLEIAAATAAGTITVTMPGSTTPRTLTVQAHECLNIRARTINSVSVQVTAIIVYWGRY